MKKWNKGFTLLELLAVIIIMGILMLIAIPSVTTYINNSKKNAYIASAKKTVEGVSLLITSKQVKLNEKDTTYYIPGSCIATESGDAVSPYADWKDRYIVVTYDGENYDYYWASTDEAKMGVYLTYRDKLDIDDIKTGVGEITTDVGVGDRENIVVFTEPCDFNPPPKPALEHIPEKGIYVPTEKPTTTPTPTSNAHSDDGLLWIKDDFQIKFEKVTGNNCQIHGQEAICYSAQFKVCNNNPTNTIKWYYAEFDVPEGTQLVSGSYLPGQAIIEIDRNKLRIRGIETQESWNFLTPGKCFTVGYQIKYPKGTNWRLYNGIIEYVVLSSPTQTGTSGTQGSAEDMWMELAKLKVEIVRKNNPPWNTGNGHNVASNYDISVTNLTNQDINGWEFYIELPESYARLDPYSFERIVNGRTYTIKPRSGDKRNKIPAGGTVMFSNAMQMEMEDPNILPIIK